MIDSYVRAGNAQALQVAIGMAAWAKQAIEGVISQSGQAHWQQVLNTEWGGMNDALYNLYNITGNRVSRVAATFVIMLTVNVCTLTRYVGPFP